MNLREQVAHHEAAHAVVALHTRLGLSSYGMDIDAPASVPGAFGKTGVMTFAADLTQPEADQFKDLGVLLAVTLAGAASDAKINSITLHHALQCQPGDLSVAKNLCAEYPFACGDQEAVALDHGLQLAAKALAKAEVWSAICAVAKACLANGGNLSKEQIETVALPILGVAGPIGLVESPV